MTGGVASLSGLLAEAGETAIAFAGLGFYLVAMAGWMFGLVVSYAAMSEAAKRKQEMGETPSWVAPLGKAGYVAEATWVIGANVAYVLIGSATLASGLLPAWAGWTAIGTGVVLTLLVMATKFGFPQMSDLAPFVLGVAAILESF